MKVILHFFLLLIAATVASACNQCDDAAIQTNLDCYDTDEPCVNLPIPDSTFGLQADPAKGYWIGE
jgi:hypothetical protein